MPIHHDDPRTKPGAYIHQGKRLYLVTDRVETPGTVWLLCEDADDGSRRRVTEFEVRAHWTLVREAPEVPDLIPA